MIRFIAVLATLVAAIFMLITSAKAEVYITVVKSEQIMYVETPTETFQWDVSTGRNGYRTPIGDFKPYVLKKMHYSKKYDNAPMPNSIFFHGGYAIHATYDIKNLGRPASHGCIRLSPQNAKWLYQIVQETGKENTFIRIVN
jgi:lipoprotein-anchoring transpeptidase ErfK/SrfK